jgi:hypothetical protein
VTSLSSFLDSALAHHKELLKELQLPTIVHGMAAILDDLWQEIQAAEVCNAVLVISRPIYNRAL